LFGRFNLVGASSVTGQFAPVFVFKSEFNIFGIYMFNERSEKK